MQTRGQRPLPVLPVKKVQIYKTRTGIIVRKSENEEIGTRLFHLVTLEVLRGCHLVIVGDTVT